MSFDAISYLRDLNINFFTSGKNVSPGWIAIQCPLCQDESNHGGFAPPDHPGSPYSCWKCGGHSLEHVVMALEGLSFHKACQRVKQFQTDLRPSVPIKFRTPSGVLKLPLGTKGLTKGHKDYLINRRFDPDYLEAKYGLLGTGPVGDCSHRIVVPVFYQGQMVSWQARDITGKSELRYKSCAPAHEVMNHKRLIYNIDHCPRQSILVVEGFTDCWRFGDHCGATFGTTFTKAQVLLLTKYKRVFLIYDGEPEAQERAQKLCFILAGLGVEAENILLDQGDPGDLDQDTADHMKGELL